MKRHILHIAIILAALCAASCVKETMSENSVIKVTETKKNDFDRWLEVNFLLPYNIDFKYRFEMNESDMNYFTIPADYEYSIVMAHLVKYLCIETYDEVAGITFTRSYFPKMFFLTGEWEYRNNGTIILGTAEGGKKIFLAGVNLLPQYMKTAEDLNHFYIKTIHHEFTHILNQNVDFPVDFSMITGTGYVADSWSDAPYNRDYLKNGFITDYAQHSDTEDFAEMLSEYITHDQSWWDGQIAKAGEKGELINAKLDIVRNYMQDSFNIDIDVLRATVLRRQDDVFAGQVDLHSIEIK
ncbi:MAG: putative zinc-binding metallopeptidase [Bacteroidales bacterium]|jgi:substrate import-associated zinc metallohydrolase lipoprotein|nr:putative zinc-binding metallopeptidase [Bacteroidales bacterium]